MANRIVIVPALAALMAAACSSGGTDAAAADHPGKASAKPSAAPAASPAPAATAAVTVSGWPSDGWPSPISASQLSPPQVAAIMKAAGYKKVGSKWIGCDGNSEGKIEDGWTIPHSVSDLNGDGHADVLVLDQDTSGGMCFNQYGQGFEIVAATPTGWKLLYSGTGIPDFAKTRGKDGWPDLTEGGPGMDCYPLRRWNGKDYGSNSPANTCK